jgi:hypothetical protein
MSSTGDTIFIKPSRRDSLLGLAASLIFVIATLYLVSVGDRGPFIWYTLLLFGSSTIFFLVAMLPGASYLRLDRSGFTRRHLFRSLSYRWHDVGPFTTGRFGWIPGEIGFSTPESEARFARMSPLHRRWVSLEFGNHQNLVGKFQIPAAELAATMNTWREEAIRHSAVPGPEPQPQRSPRGLYVAVAIIWAYLVIGVAAFYLQFRADL